MSWQTPDRYFDWVNLHIYEGARDDLTRWRNELYFTRTFNRILALGAKYP